LSQIEELWEGCERELGFDVLELRISVVEGEVALLLYGKGGDKSFNLGLMTAIVTTIVRRHDRSSSSHGLGNEIMISGVRR